MSCLTHDKRFRAVFHNIINDFRNENRTPVSVLRTMPKKCCTCEEKNNETMELIVMKEENQSSRLNALIERVNREKGTNPTLVLSLNRFQNLIEENRGPVLLEKKPLPVPQREKSTSWNFPSYSPAYTPMETSKQSVRYRKTAKKVNRGTFLFLPYTFDGRKATKTSDSLLDVAKALQRNRFINRQGHIALLEKQYNVRINMITSKTSQQVTEALKNAKRGLDKLTIHDKEKSVPLSQHQEGEWVLIRSKESQNRTSEADIEQALEDLTSRWESALNISKRGHDDDSGYSGRPVRRRR